jgi:S-adenosylmethionine hydrolase
MSRFQVEKGVDLKKVAIPAHRSGSLLVADGLVPSVNGDPGLSLGKPTINKDLSDLGPFASRPGKRRLLVPEALAEQPKPIPLLLVSDFGDDRSTVECEQRIHAVYQKKGLTYEAPHRAQDIERFHIPDGAYNIYQLVSTARKDEQPSVFVGVVDPGVGSDRRGVVISTEEGYTFVGPDNGLFWPAIQYNGLHIKDAYLLDPKKFQDSSVTFHGRDQFSPIGARIATGEEPWEIEGLERLDPETLVKYEFERGQVVEKDGYPNVKLWPEGLPLNERNERPTHVKITNPKGFDPDWDEEGIVHGKDDEGDSILIPVVPTFESVKVGKPLCYVGSSGNEGLPELAIRQGEGENGMGNRMKVDIGNVLQVEWIYGPTEKDLHAGEFATL